MKIFSKIINKDLFWLLGRIFREFKRPVYRPVKIFMDFLYGVISFFFSLFVKSKNSDNCLMAVYDLSSCSISFDFAYFLAGAESYAIKHGKDSFFVLIVRDDSEELDPSVYNSIIDKYSSKWRLENIIIPLISLYPQCFGYSVLPSRENIDKQLRGSLTFPQHYGANYNPVMDYKEIFSLLGENKFVGFSASKQGIRYAKLWLKSRFLDSTNIVTIVLRSYGYDSVRNSNIDEWIKFYEWVSLEGYNPVFILDTDASYVNDDRFNELNVFREGCWNLGLRMALYELSYLVFDSQGTGSIAQLSRNVRYIRNNLMIEDSFEATSRQWEDRGVVVGQKNFKFATELQFLSWKGDSFENIREEFIYFVDAELKESKKLIENEKNKNSNI